MKRFKKGLKKALTLGLVIFMLPARYASAGGHDGVLVDQADHSDLDFSEYKYEHMDEKDFDAIIAPLDDIAMRCSSSSSTWRITTMCCRGIVPSHTSIPTW